MNPSEITIVENPKEVDWNELHTLLLDSYAYMDSRINPPSSLHQLDAKGLQQKAENEIYLAAVRAEALIGCMFCNPINHWLYVGKVAVSQNHQGRGIGRQLFDHAFNIARQKDLKGLELETRIELVENHRAFEKLGFHKIGEYAHEGHHQPTFILMRAELSKI